MKLVDETMPIVKARLMDDKTLWVAVGNVEQIGRVIIEGGSTFCRVFYADSAKGEWIETKRNVMGEGFMWNAQNVATRFM